MIHKRKIIFSLILILILIFILIFFSYSSNFDLEKEDIESIKTEEDLNFLFESIENTHPSFYLNEVPEKYYIEKEKMKLEVDLLKENPNNFKFRISQLLSTLNDLHSSLDYQNIQQKYLDVKFYYVNDKLMLLENNNISDYYVSKIGNKNISEILDFIRKTFPVENKSSLNGNFENYSKDIDVLSFLEIKYFELIDIEFINIYNKSDIKIISYKVQDNLYQYKNYLETSLKEDVIYIDINRLIIDNEFELAVEKIKTYIEEGYTKVLIDVIDCPGGSSIAYDMIFDALYIDTSIYSMYVPFSKKIMEQQGDNYSSDIIEKLKLDGYVEVKSDLNDFKNNNNIELVIIINESSASGSLQMATLIQDGNLGTVIGEISRNSPNFYADNGYYKLPNSKISYTVSMKNFYRPDQTANHKELIPDISTNYNENIFQVAMDYLRNPLISFKS